MSDPTTKNVDGKDVPLTASEIAAIKAEWAANTPLTPAQKAASDLASQRQSAKDAASTLPDGTSKAMRAIVAVMLDEINAVRVKLAMQPRTMAQVKAAILAKIDGGSVD